MNVYHETNDADLIRQLEDAKIELRQLRFTFGVARSLQNPGRIRYLKRNIARIRTVQSEREKGIRTQQEVTNRKTKAAKPAKESSIVKEAPKKSEKAKAEPKAEAKKKDTKKTEKKSDSKAKK